ncbi:MAG: hypothetical protein QOD43_410, partial [Gaiellaceae bacterium]|nr:hypothetical protein [Gaiellaceae bacterium]
EAVEGTPNIGLSEEVFPEGGEPQAEVAEEGEVEPAAEVTEAEPEAEAEPEEEIAPESEEPAPEQLDESIEADQASPDEPGPGDSEGETPAPPD